MTPGVHAVHWRSAVAEPGADMPSPAAHMVHAAQVARPVAAVNVPFAHSVHTRSLVAVAAELVYVPLLQAELTARHTSSLSAMENVVPVTQAEHWRSAVAVPSTVRPSPAGQVRHAAHELWSDVAVNVPPGHGEQTRLDVAVAAELSNVPATHTGVSVAHTRSADLVGADTSNCSAVHVSTDPHALASSAAE